MDQTITSHYQSKRYRQLLLKALRQKPNGATIADLVVLTGLPTDWVEYTLRYFLGVYPCRLKTNQQDELVYLFDLRPGKQSWQNQLLTWAKTTAQSKRFRTQKKVLYQTLTYIFGAARKSQDRLFTEKVILNYIRHNQGKIVVAELVQITGWSIYEAETQAAQLLARYQGEVEVTEDGVIIYHFEELAQASEHRQEITESLKIWERPLPERQLNPNDEATNQKLEKINRQNLVASSLTSLLTGALVLSQQFGMVANLLLLASTTALSFSSVFFLVPAIRQFYLYLENEKIRIQNVETYILKGIFHRVHSKISPDKDLKKMIQETKPQRQYHYWWNRYLPSSVYEYSLILTSTYHRELLLQKKAIELEAEIDVDQNGDLYYHFERLNRELATINRLRKFLS